MINQPQVKAVIGDLKLCEKMAQFDPKKFAEVQGKIKQSTGGDNKVRDRSWGLAVGGRTDFPS